MATFAALRILGCGSSTGSRDGASSHNHCGPSTNNSGSGTGCGGSSANGDGGSHSPHGPCSHNSNTCCFYHYRYDAKKEQ